ncbi:sugar phosphate isomerase/epimerase family protein [Paenibacillus shunpengii]|uniref:Sugar phosphate isomerase/epimerase family protein n=1 Tax=Paenibacillus shunpengii TaxID=2054424 RepID=A0ABW5SQX1_9BACL|nr:sugar phosphate isomerase/epimerase family protein [Paenibacillus sp. PDC88]SDX19834.1 Sugar phosphate isomerase/epimerase [Paenibacillus sp. PDC88]
MTQLSIGSWAFAFGPFEQNPWPFERVLKYAKEAGYDGIEVNGFLPHPVPELYPTRQMRAELLQLIQSYGLGVSAYAPDFRMVPPAIVTKESYLELLKRHVEFTKDLGADLLRVDTVTPAGPLNGREYQERFARLIDTWHASSEITAEAGLRLVWEFEPGFWLNKPSEVLRTVREVQHPSFQILFDTSHAYMSGVIGAKQDGERELLTGGVLEYASLLDGHIGHFHLIDSDGTLHGEETSTHAEFGAGYIDFQALLASHSATFNALSWWCVDFCFNAEAEVWGREAVPFIKQLVKEAATQ